VSGQVQLRCPYPSIWHGRSPLLVYSPRPTPHCSRPGTPDRVQARRRRRAIHRVVQLDRVTVFDENVSRFRSATGTASSCIWRH
jgi:hypothetical protein